MNRSNLREGRRKDKLERNESSKTVFCLYILLCFSVNNLIMLIGYETQHCILCCIALNKLFVERMQSMS